MTHTRGRTPPRQVDRLSAADLTQLVTDVGPTPMNIGAVLLLDPGALPFDLAGARATLADRVAAIPRLRQRLAPVPLGLGRPVWVQDAAFDATRHITVRVCPEPRDADALLDAAVAEVVQPLPRARPLWRAVFVTGLAGGRVGLVLVLHHVLADGIGGLAFLAALADPGPRVADGPAQDPPTPRDLAVDRARSAARSLRSIPRTVTTMRQAAAELGHGESATPRCSLNAPTGPRRRVRTVDVELDAVRAAARRHGSTVNDLLLVAVTAGMEQLLAQRGEHVPALVVSVPITARVATTAQRLGNAVGVMPVAVRLAGSLDDRLTEVAAATAAQRGATGSARGASAAVVLPVFRALARIGAFRWMINRQRLVNTFLTNLRGPVEPVRLHDATVAAIVPVTTTAGNVTIAFAALSYAGTLTVTVIADPDQVPDQDRLVAAVHEALASLTHEA